MKLQPARRKVCVFKVGAAHSLSSICDEWAAGKPTFFSGCIGSKLNSKPRTLKFGFWPSPRFTFHITSHIFTVYLCILVYNYKSWVSNHHAELQDLQAGDLVGTSRGRPGCGQKKVSLVLAFLGNQGMTRDILGLNPLARAKCQRFSRMTTFVSWAKLS